jgi:hypothetical protein
MAAARRRAPVVCWLQRSNLLTCSGRRWAVGFIFGPALSRANHIGGFRDTLSGQHGPVRPRKCSSRGINLIRTQRSAAGFARTQAADIVTAIGSAANGVRRRCGNPDWALKVPRCVIFGTARTYSPNYPRCRTAGVFRRSCSQYINEPEVTAHYRNT